MSKPRSETHRGQVTEIRKLINALGGQCWTTHQSGRLAGSAGIPDMCAVVRGLAFWIEVKIGRDKLRPAQAGFKAVWDAAGVPVVVGRACDVADWLETRQGSGPGDASRRIPAAKRTTGRPGVCACGGACGAISGGEGDE